MTNQMKYLFGFILLLIIPACIGDDIIDDRVPAQLRIANPISELKAGDSYQLETVFTNIVGKEVDTDITYVSEDDDIATVTSEGLITGIAGGNATITLTAASEDGPLVVAMAIEVGAVTVVTNEARTGTLQTTSSYVLDGNFNLSQQGSDLILAFDNAWKTTDVLPGLYVYLSNNKNSNANALEISKVTVFEGAHQYTLPSGTGLNDYSHVLFYCKPYGIKVGDGPFDN